MIIGIYGFKDSGKTMVQRAIVERLVALKTWQGVLSVMSLFGIEHTKLTIAEMKVVIMRMVEVELRDHIIVLDEIDKIFKARDWKEKAQTEAVANFWQSFKLDTWLIYTAHRGRGADIIIRLATDVLIITRLDGRGNIVFEVNDLQHYGLTNPQYHSLADISEWFDKYDRWELVR